MLSHIDSRFQSPFHKLFEVLAKNKSVFAALIMWDKVKVLQVAVLQTILKANAIVENFELVHFAYRLFIIAFNYFFLNVGRLSTSDQLVIEVPNIEYRPSRVTLISSCFHKISSV
jgi:hypothetical protein